MATAIRGEARGGSVCSLSPATWLECTVLPSQEWATCGATAAPFAQRKLNPLTAAGAIVMAKLGLVPVRRGYWGNKIGKVRPRFS